jgi:sugar phosphate isomerase/epimerase
MALFAEAVDLAAWFGSKVVQSDSFLPPVEILENPLYEDDVHFERSTRVRVPRGFDWPRYWDVVVETFASCARIAGDRGLRLAIEPRVGETLSNTDALLRLIDQADSPHLGVVFDTAHLHAQRELLPLSVHKLADRIFHVHLADNDGTTNRHAAPGTGTVDWVEVLRALDDVGYAGPLMLDVGKVDELDAEVRRGGDFVAGVLAGLSAGPAGGGART